jgi:hypothetical protein
MAVAAEVDALQERNLADGVPWMALDSPPTTNITIRHQRSTTADDGVAS